MLIDCAECHQPIEAAREPGKRYEFVHGSCVGEPVLIHERFIKDQDLGPASWGPCECDGCWACTGHVLGCTCHVDWDRLHEAARDA